MESLVRELSAVESVVQERKLALVAAAERVGDTETADRRLVGDAARMPADLFGKRAREWADNRESADAVGTRHERQRKNRSAMALPTKFALASNAISMRWSVWCGGGPLSMVLVLVVLVLPG